MRKLIVLSSLIALFTACRTPENPPQTVTAVELDQYTGKWYEIASYPNRFQKGCSCTTAEYRLTKKGHIEVLNRCLKDGEWSETKGKAFPVKGSNNSKLKVQFFWPFKGDYWIIHLSEKYRWAVISDPEREYLWILSREKQMEEAVYNQILSELQQKGYDISDLEKTEQNCDN